MKRSYPPLRSQQPIPLAQPKNPVYGLTLEAVVTALAAQYDRAGLGERIAVHCFTHEPSVPSSLKFLRKTPWAGSKVEGLYCSCCGRLGAARFGHRGNPAFIPRDFSW